MKTPIIGDINKTANVLIIDIEPDIVDNNEDCEFNQFLVYQETLSEYTILKALRLNTPEELADHLIDIFAVIEPPKIILINDDKERYDKLSGILANNLSVLNISLEFKENGSDSANRIRQLKKEFQEDFRREFLHRKDQNRGKSQYLVLKSIQINYNNRVSHKTGKTPMKVLFSHLISRKSPKIASSSVSERNMISKKANDSKSSKDNNSLECPYCNQQFTFPSILNRHLRSHTNERPYTCEICAKTFKQIGHLTQHALTHPNSESSEINSSKSINRSPKIVPDMNSPKDSPKSVEKSSHLKCDYCEKRFVAKVSLKRHLLRHNENRRFVCEICGKKFKQTAHLKSHLVIHTGERKFACEMCPKRFSFANSLKKHMYIHSGEKPYQCDVCGSRFLEKRNLTGHMMTHTNRRPFGCKICDKRYTLADTLKRHVSAAHENGRIYQCEICAKMFKQLAHLSVHKKVHTDERPFQCHLCDKNFKHKNVLKSHLAIHANLRPFECDVCKANFVRKTNLQTHISSAHMDERPYCCNICNKRFKQVSHLNGHIVVHSNSMPYQCDYCERRCNRMDNLKKHMKIHERKKNL